MKRLTEEDIKDINKRIEDSDSGIFVQPTYIPTDIKGPVCYMRWNPEGRPGTCWDDEDTINEVYYNERPEFEALTLALEIIGAPDEKSYIEGYFLRTNDDAGSYVGYYGDYDDYKAEWVELEDIYKYLGI